MPGTDLSLTLNKATEGRSGYRTKNKNPIRQCGEKKIHFIQGTDGGLDMDAGHYSDLMLIAAAWRTVWMAAWKAAWKATWKAA